MPRRGRNPDRLEYTRTFGELVEPRGVGPADLRRERQRRERLEREQRRRSRTGRRRRNPSRIFGVPTPIAVGAAAVVGYLALRRGA